MLSDGFEKDPRETWEARMCRGCVGSVGAVIGTAGSSWERPAGEVYGFHSDGLFLMPPSPNVYRGPLERGVRLREEGRGEKYMNNTCFQHSRRLCTLNFRAGLSTVIIKFIHSGEKVKLKNFFKTLTQVESTNHKIFQQSVCSGETTYCCYMHFYFCVYDFLASI